MKRIPSHRHLKADESGDFMKGYDERRLESFLLDELPSPDREEIEQRLFADDEMFARVEDLETDLIDAYAAGTLTPDLRARFERSLETSPARREKLLVARLLLEKLPAANREGGSNVVPFSRRRAIAFRGALAAALLVILVGTPMLLFRDDDDRTTVPPQVAEATDAGKPAAAGTVPDTNPTAATESAAAAETPLIAVKRPPVPMVAEGTAPSPTKGRRSAIFVLSTVTLRSGTGLSTLEIGEGLETVSVQLVLESDEYPRYAVDIRDAAGSSIWTVRRVSVTTMDGGPALSFDVPATAFSTGRHELVLAGVDEDHTEEVAYVDFEVRR